jgi:HAD superfamily hydrolase (TIGR01490 family)
MNTGVGSERAAAAFFDLDGTLVGPASLERRFLADLWRRRAIPTRNYFLWLLQAARLAPQGLAVMRHANKMYLRGVRVEEAAGLFRTAQARVPVLLRHEGLERVAWHTAQGHAIVLVSGTPAPLARNVAVKLGMRLALRGLAGSIEVCATELEERAGCWTGRIVGEAMFGEAKARAVRRLAKERGFDLERCYAYADCASDRWMLQAVGRPVAVNPSWALARIARRCRWTVLRWTGEETHHREHRVRLVRREEIKTLGRTWDERQTRTRIFGE